MAQETELAQPISLVGDTMFPVGQALEVECVRTLALP
jgi:hypothetical protein